VVDGDLDRAHVDAAGESEVGVEQVAVAVLFGRPAAEPLCPGAVVGAGEVFGEFGERLAAWLIALSVWTEWHAAHHPAPDPCA
jgi:hypothetical protein